MKMTPFHNRKTWSVTAIVAAGILTACAFVTPRLRANDDQPTTSSFTQKLQQWEDEMTNSFRDTFKKLRAEDKENSIGTASVDLREQPKEYVVRLNLPGRDLSQVDCALEGNSLHIVAPAGANIGRYEQSIVLADATPDAKVDIKRNQSDSLVVVTVPKEVSPANEGTASSSGSASSLLPLADWDRQMFDQMRKMQEDMDREFNDSFHALGHDPQLKGFFDEPSFGSSIDLQDGNGNYTVKAYLPNRDMQNVSVTVSNDVLTIEAKSQDKKEGGSSGPNIIHEAKYSQAVTLPGPVDAGKMKVDKKEGMLIITLPKK